MKLRWWLVIVVGSVLIGSLAGHIATLYPTVREPTAKNSPKEPVLRLQRARRPPPLTEFPGYSPTYTDVGTIILPTKRPGDGVFSDDPDKVVEKTVESVAQMMALGEAVKKLPDGDIAMDPPTRMTVGDSQIVTAVIGVQVPKPELNSSVEPASDDRQLVEGKLKVGYKMSADLVGQGFEIKRISDEIREVAVGIPAQWQWQVEAKAEGQNLLKVALYAHMPKSKSTVPLAVKTFSRVVSVGVRPQTWGEWANSTASSITEGIQTASGLWQAVVGFAALVFGGVYGTTLLRGIKSLWNRITAQKPAAR